MNREMMEGIREGIRGFRLPRYEQIPSVGLYLEQTVQYINECLAAVNQEEITGSMISNYVKKGLIKSPVRKQYSREQIAYLIFIAIGKLVLSMDDLLLMVEIQQRTYPSEIAYEYFRKELDTVLRFVFGRRGELDALGADAPDEKIMLRNVIITAAHKLYLDQLFLALREENAGKQTEHKE